ncbi:hypothetical protein [Limnofasciculus baicalensis]|uniref:Uncharacterized protein n=1 Tax=Limnofasciculus baicalensis BBK-W-15 TaxID=2699891 RepID=A0AAE3GNQ5_9CYAN|nr:hypothetical protein [Limnofasciculus baicalensis]MCP2727257.1 hypothetical protein [Limnofasciculus baicalensis BBK-W-15]
MPDRHYLSAAGAIALATNGFREGSVDEWLKNSRDYYLSVHDNYWIKIIVTLYVGSFVRIMMSDEKYHVF